MKLTTTLTALAGLVFFAGCPGQQNSTGTGQSGSASSKPTPAASTAAAGGVVRLPLEMPADDPALSGLDLGDQRLWALARAVEMPVIKVAPDGELQPGLAASWHSDETGTTWTLTIPQPAGADSLSEELVDSWREILRGSPTPLREQLADLAAAFRDGRALEISGLSAGGDGLEIQLTRPDRVFPQWLSQPGLGLAGYGAFAIERMPEAGSPSEIVLKPNPQSLAGQPLLDQLVFVCEPDRAAQLTLFQAGELDSANVSYNLASQGISQAAASWQGQPASVQQNTTAEMLLCIYNYSRFPWDDGQFQSRVGLRAAMNWGLDLELLAELSGEQFAPWPHFLPALWQDYLDPAGISAPLYPLTPRIEQARKSMIEADHEQGIRLPLGMDVAYLPEENTKSLALDVMDYWREISIKMGPFGESRATLLDRISNKSHEVILKRVRPAYRDPDALTYAQLYSALAGEGGNWTELADDGIDAQVRAIQAEDDQVSRTIALRKLCDELEQRALFVFIGYSTPTILLSPELAGYQLGPFDFDASLPAQDFTALGRTADATD